MARILKVVQGRTIEEQIASIDSLLAVCLSRMAIKDKAGNQRVRTEIKTYPAKDVTITQDRPIVKLIEE